MECLSGSFEAFCEKYGDAANHAETQEDLLSWCSNLRRSSSMPTLCMQTKKEPYAFDVDVESSLEVSFTPRRFPRSGWARRTFTDEGEDWSHRKPTQIARPVKIIGACSEDHWTSRHESKPPAIVRLQVYDIMKLTQVVNLDIFHLGVEVYHREYYFGVDGIQACRPKCHSAHFHRIEVPLGLTQLSFIDITGLLTSLRHSWNSKTYNLFGHNCQSFAVALCKILGFDVPAEYCRHSMFGPSVATLEAYTSLIRQPFSACSAAPPLSARKTTTMETTQQPSVARPSARTPMQPARRHTDEDLNYFSSQRLMLPDEEGSPNGDKLEECTLACRRRPPGSFFSSYFRGGHVVEDIAHSLFINANPPMRRS